MQTEFLPYFLWEVILRQPKFDHLVFVGIKLRGKSKPVIKWLRKLMFKGFTYKNGVFKCNIIMELKNIAALKDRVSMCFLLFLRETKALLLFL